MPGVNLRRQSALAPGSSGTMDRGFFLIMDSLIAPDSVHDAALEGQSKPTGQQLQWAFLYLADTHDSPDGQTFGLLMQRMYGFPSFEKGKAYKAGQYVNNLLVEAREAKDLNAAWQAKYQRDIDLCVERSVTQCDERDALKVAIAWLEQGFKNDQGGGKHHCPWCYKASHFGNEEDGWADFHHTPDCIIGKALIPAKTEDAA